MNKAFTERFQSIVKQIEYYFSDDNLSKDEFFHTTISSDPNVK